jgi:hypothetical protein
MPTITTDVEVDIDLRDIDDYDLVNELEDRGFDVIEHGTRDQDLIEMVQARGYGVYDPKKDKRIFISYLEELYTTYTTMPREFFDKELKKFFREQLNVNEY